MSQEHEAHEGPIKTPKQLVTAVIMSFVVPIIVIVLLVDYVTSQGTSGAGSDSMTEEAVARRIQPIGDVTLKDAAAAAVVRTGEEVYKAQCAACHATGAAGAPKFSDAGAWAPRLGQGFEALWQSALKGKGAMAAQGGGDFSDYEIARAVVYLANAGGGKFDEPKAPAGDKPAATDAGGESPAAPAEAAPAVEAAAPATESPPAPVPSAPVPAAEVKVAAAAAAPPAVYQSICLACHAAGVAGAPKTGDKAAWAPRLSAGLDGLTASVIKGKGAMPPKGGAVTASDADIKAAVAYMIDQVK